MNAHAKPAGVRAKALARFPDRFERINADILEVAAREFADHGFAGARIDVIAAQISTSKRMIYYHFGSKEGLYQAVLFHAYERMRATDTALSLKGLAPLAALKALVGATFDHRVENEDFIRLVMGENILQARHLSRIDDAVVQNAGALATLKDICDRGVRAGEIRPGLDPLDLHMSISALCFFQVSNKHTFALLHGADMTGEDALRRRRETVIQTILAFVRPTEVLATSATGAG